MKISKTMTFEACHKLPDEECYGACRNLHGHSYVVEVIIEGSVNEKGWVMNFKDLKAVMKKCIYNKYDHSDLNAYFEIPTAELMVNHILNELADELNDYELEAITLRLWETANSYAEDTYIY